MTVQHPDFQAEVERLAYTQGYMQQILDESQRDLKSAQENIRKSMADLDYLDSSLSYLNILTNARFFEMARNQKEGLEAVRKKPYFARIHFQKTGDPEEFLYIGKTSLFHRETHEPIIVDWRSPVANVYYDGRLGDMEYDVRGEVHKGHLFAKRQYKIENGELLDIRDIDLTTNDELLQEALAGKADVRLTEIVSTIQKEQNEIIRAHLRQPIIVQGAAGSGKTTIALHRISYFLYTMGEHFNPEQLMILAPNKLFIDYIGDVLPELGVDKICQTTFTDYVLSATKLKLKLQNPNEQLELLVAGGSQPTDWIAEMKGSLYYRDVIERYVQKLEQRIAEQFEDVYIEKYCIMRASHLKKLFLYEFSYMPIEKRLEHIKKVLASHVRQKKQAVLATLHKKYDEALGKALNGIRDDEKRRRVVTKFIDERDERIPAIEKETKTTASAYMRRFPKHNIKTLYRTLLTDAELLAELAPEWHYLEQQQFLQAHRKEQWALEDLAALYYLQARLKGIADEWKMRVVFIDEVQDYSLFQLAALKAGLDTDMFTMVGDLAQGIHSYRSLTAWEPVQSLFPRASFRTLQKSYRTTIEIMEVANQILAQMNEQLPLVEPVVRHGNVPSFIQEEQFDAFKIKEIFEAIRQNGHRSIALICKTTAEAITMQQALKDNDIASQLLTENESINQEMLLVVPSHLAKGLEFDAVIVAAYDTPFYDTPIDRKLLYVALTRAMHELYLIGPSKKTFLLEN
ncbi:AAA family ATPase [Lysinibacillus sp. OL1_EC]|uniref:RNA polymerase recycling motor HelD n=1 Tax=unclassified Lysinibacillus TaxID=2636778 RepID=UPI00103C8913|nr:MULTISPECIES: RNA polymerase recycling motor HelD [unclassified Lysinibacillus]MCM0624590.1 AAA family ATPase [Lysinibacillus sp. OL1_EC]MCS5501811.1 AAA family ATPase [Lysinibacillus sp. A4]TBV87928.1 DNA helicase [Lysinibacillus sp. OL1]UKJ45827.1 AAA family ATPase [Lysinibacillus sp. ACHW1.5]WGT39164.1 RNA polymerase recycling motor HelD [Lysinibacillus sp. 1 U-2021]